MAFGLSDLETDKFQRQDWEAAEFGEWEEILPENRREAQGVGFVMTAYGDANHTSNTVTGRYRTGFLVYHNSAPIFWYSKKQSTIGTNSFGSECMTIYETLH